MKTFLNVLYRRILYKLPLKLLLIILAVLGVFAVCFSSAEEVGSLINSYEIPSISINTIQWKNIIDLNNEDQKTVCVRFEGHVNATIYFGIAQNSNSAPDAYVRYYRGWAGKYYCIYKSENDKYLTAMSQNSTDTIYGDYFILDTLLDTTIPVYTSLECQTEYNLIPISSVDQNYCTTNNLCPAGGTPSDCPNVGVSNIFINDIFHPGAFNIVMNIPEEIDWDYAYTNSGQNFNIDVVGYNVDYEKIDSIVQFQNYKPTSEDFQKIIGLLAPYTKIIVFFVFLFIVWAWIKKPFKSKKL